MPDESKRNELELYRAMKKKIDQVDRLVLEMEELGRGLPFIEKNSRCILSFLNVMKHGVSDVVDVLD